MELVILAGGLGHRYGGDKQVAPVDAQDDFLMDYSIFDAVRCGFDRVVFVIRSDLVEVFEKTIIARIQSYIECVIVIQGDQGAERVDASKRTRPLGTAHGLLCCKNVINESFVMINADDYYGQDAFKSAAEFIQAHPHLNASISYDAGKTISPSGAENRGICRTAGDRLVDIIESSICRDESGRIIGRPHVGGEVILQEDTQVSMNMFVFSSEIFSKLEAEFQSFLSSADLSKDEFLVPNAVRSFVLRNELEFRVVGGHGHWFGMTYSHDRIRVMQELALLKQKGIYPENLWCSEKQAIDP